MPKHVLVATEKPFAKVAVAGITGIFSQAGYEVTLLESYKDKADYLKAAAAADALIVRSDIVDAEVLQAAPNLKIVVRAGAGYDNIDLKAATAHGVVAMNTPGQNSNAVAELVFGLMITLARRGFSGKDGTELRGKKIGIHAYGNVGKCVATIARGFGMDVFALRSLRARRDDEGRGRDAGRRRPTNCTRTCDYISLHLPKTKDTVKSIGAALLSKMKKGGTLINTARAEVIDEAGLLQVMEERSGLHVRRRRGA